MLRFLLAAWAAALVCLAVAMPAFAQGARGADAWEVTANAEVKSCFAFSGSTSRAVRLGLEDGTLSIVVFDEKLAWIKNGQEYSAQFLIDRSRWDGSLYGLIDSDGRTGLGILGLNEAFGGAIAGGSRMTVVIDGATYGPYSLKGSRAALSDLADCMRSLAAPEPQVADTAPRLETAGELVDWSDADIGRPISIDKLSLLLSSVDDTTVRATVRDETRQVAAFELTTGMRRNGQFGLLALGDYGPGTLLVTSWTGGAHCCLEVVAAVPDGSDYRVTQLGAYNIERPTVEDIDVDGTQELLVPDERFLQFDGFAGSFPPRKIFKARDGELRDVSADWRFAAAHRAYYALQSTACELSANVNRGACAGLLGTAARLGLFEPTLYSLDFETPEESPWEQSICMDERCTERREFPNLKEAVLQALPRWGYGNPVQNEGFTGFLKGLTGQTYGLGETEMSCDDYPVALRSTPGAAGTPMLDIHEYESGCVSSNGLLVGETLYTEMVCQGEGAPPWLLQRLIARDDETLEMIDAPSSMMDLGGKRVLARCSIDPAPAQ